MDFQDYYKTLGVATTATPDELKKAYRKRARENHPDIHPSDSGATSRFAKLSEAYEVLSDEDKRRKYDALESDYASHQSSAPSAPFDWSRYASGGSDAGEADASEFFRSFFGEGFGSSAGPRPRRGRDLRASLTLTLEEAFAGGRRHLTVGTQAFSVLLKPGVWDGQSIRLPGRGSLGAHGGEAGDLYLTFLHQPNSEYRLEGADLHRNLEVGLYDLLLGTTLEVVTISGVFQLKVPPETKNAAVFRLKGKGFPVYGKAGVQGNLYLRVVVQLPQHLTTTEQKLLRELAALRKPAATA